MKYDSLSWYPSDEIQSAVDLVFLALVVWREARGEPPEARLAVAYSILNRVFRPSWWGHDILSVTTKKWQYSSMTNPKDPQLTTYPSSSDPSWADCLYSSYLARNSLTPNPAPGADSFYDTSIPPPKWADPAKMVVNLGRLIFFNLDQDYEDPKEVTR